jgi:hypothetical protein
VIATWDLNKLGSNIYVVACIVNGLAAAIPDIILVPAITSHTLMLFTCVTEICILKHSISGRTMLIENLLNLQSFKFPHTLLHGLKILHLGP